MAALYLHYEEAVPEFTMKCALLPPTRAPQPKRAPPPRAQPRPPYAWQAAVGCRSKRS